jgi:hypothetical protein
MLKDEQKDNNSNKNSGNNYLKFAGMGFQMIAIIGLFAYGGYKIDEAASHHTKWVTAALALTGVFISLYLVIKSIKD